MKSEAQHRLTCPRIAAYPRRSGTCPAGRRTTPSAGLADPLRESARRCVIATYLAEDNLVEAVLHYNCYAELLMEELGVGPSAELRVLVCRAVAARGRRGSGQHAVQLRTRPYSQHTVEPRAIPVEGRARLPMVTARQMAGHH